MDCFNYAKWLCLVCISILETNFVLPEKFLVLFAAMLHSKKVSPSNHDGFRKRYLLLLLLLISGLQPNPGPDIATCSTPSEFRERSGLGIIHLNIRSLLLKTDMLHIWAKSTDADIIVPHTTI